MACLAVGRRGPILPKGVDGQEGRNLWGAPRKGRWMRESLFGFQAQKKALPRIEYHSHSLLSTMKKTRMRMGWLVKRKKKKKSILMQPKGWSRFRPFVALPLVLLRRGPAVRSTPSLPLPGLLFGSKQGIVPMRFLSLPHPTLTPFVWERYHIGVFSYSPPPYHSTRWASRRRVTAPHGSVLLFMGWREKKEAKETTACPVVLWWISHRLPPPPRLLFLSPLLLLLLLLERGSHFRMIYFSASPRICTSVIPMSYRWRDLPSSPPQLLEKESKKMSREREGKARKIRRRAISLPVD